MAGGAGTRFWPLSRKRTPKQVLAINGPNSMLSETLARLSGLVSMNNTLVVTSQQQSRVIKPHLPDLHDDNLLLEPMLRNTAPCIGLAAIHIRRRDPDGIMLVLPADHLIKDIDAFQRVLSSGIEVVDKNDSLVTIGIPPSRPETAYGYIQFEQSGDKKLPEVVHRVKAFAEKPNRETAELFVESGDFYWNSGIFIWKASTILDEMEEHLPDQYKQLNMIEQALGTPDYDKVLSSRYKLIKGISIDYGIMEVTSRRIYMISGDFGWSDVGSWDELYRLSVREGESNVEIGETVILDAKHNYIYSPGKLTAVIGMDNILVVNTSAVTLICPLERAQDVKEIVEKLKKEKKTRFL